VKILGTPIVVCSDQIGTERQHYSNREDVVLASAARGRCRRQLFNGKVDDSSRSCRENDNDNGK